MSALCLCSQGCSAQLTSRSGSRLSGRSRSRSRGSSGLRLGRLGGGRGRSSSSNSRGSGSGSRPLSLFGFGLGRGLLLTALLEGSLELALQVVKCAESCGWDMTLVVLFSSILKVTMTEETRKFSGGVGDGFAQHSADSRRSKNKDRTKLTNARHDCGVESLAMGDEAAVGLLFDSIRRWDEAVGDVGKAQEKVDERRRDRPLRAR